MSALTYRLSVSKEGSTPKQLKTFGSFVTARTAAIRKLYLKDIRRPDHVVVDHAVPGRGVEVLFEARLLNGKLNILKEETP